MRVKFFHSTISNIFTFYSPAIHISLAPGLQMLPSLTHGAFSLIFCFCNREHLVCNVSLIRCCSLTDDAKCNFHSLRIKFVHFKNWISTLLPRFNPPSIASSHRCPMLGHLSCRHLVPSAPSKIYHSFDAANVSQMFIHAIIVSPKKFHWTTRVIDIGEKQSCVRYKTHGMILFMGCIRTW